MAEIDERAGAELRAHRRRRIREEVRRNALKLFASRGFDNVTVEEIAARSHISQRTFFRYFATKEDLLFDQETYFALLGEFLRDVPLDEAPDQALKHAFVEVFKLFESDQRMMTAMRKITLEKPALLSRATGLLLVGMDPIVAIMADRMGCDPDTDMRPMVVVANGIFTAMMVIRMWSMDNTETMSSLQARISSPSDLEALLATHAQKVSA